MKNNNKKILSEINRIREVMGILNEGGKSNIVKGVLGFVSDMLVKTGKSGKLVKLYGEDAARLIRKLVNETDNTPISQTLKELESASPKAFEDIYEMILNSLDNMVDDATGLTIPDKISLLQTTYRTASQKNGLSNVIKSFDKEFAKIGIDDEYLSSLIKEKEFFSNKEFKKAYDNYIKSTSLSKKITYDDVFNRERSKIKSLTNDEVDVLLKNTKGLKGIGQKISTFINEDMARLDTIQKILVSLEAKVTAPGRIAKLQRLLENEVEAGLKNNEKLYKDVSDWYNANLTMIKDGKTKQSVSSIVDRSGIFKIVEATDNLQIGKYRKWIGRQAKLGSWAVASQNPIGGLVLPILRAAGKKMAGKGGFWKEFLAPKPLFRWILTGTDKPLSTYLKGATKAEKNIAIKYANAIKRYGLDMFYQWVSATIILSLLESLGEYGAYSFENAGVDMTKVKSYFNLEDYNLEKDANAVEGINQIGVTILDNLLEHKFDINHPLVIIWGKQIFPIILSLIKATPVVDVKRKVSEAKDMINDFKNKNPINNVKESGNDSDVAREQTNNNDDPEHIKKLKNTYKGAIIEPIDVENNIYGVKYGSKIIKVKWDGNDWPEIKE